MRPQTDAGGASDVDGAPQRNAEGLGDTAPRRNRFAASQATPLMVDGRLYVTTPYARVVALDATTGRELWATPIPGPGQPSLRGLEYWPGDGTTPPRLFFGTRDGRLIALDAATGAFAAAFGDNGVVQLATPEILQGGDARFYGMTSPPLVYDDLVITGSAVQEFPPRGAAGDVRAWDARSGELVWTFHSVPRPGERFADTWQGDGAERRSGVNVWGFMTVDVERGILYMPFAAPAFDRYGGDRHGDNLFSSSIVAADARTGRYLWHFQVVHHDIWDNDLQAPPLLFDARVGGATVPAVAVSSKNGLLFFLNRVSGAPIHAVEERPVPASDVPGEAAAPTQPHPVVTPPLARTAFAADDVAELTPEHTQWCRRLDRGQADGRRRPLPSRASQSTHDQLSGPARRQQLGRRRLRSNDGAALSQHQRPRPSHRARAFDGPARVRTRARRAGASCSRRHACRVRSRRGGSCTPSIRRPASFGGRRRSAFPTTYRSTSKTRGGPTSAGRSSRQAAWSSSAQRTTTAFARSTRGAAACCGRILWKPRRTPRPSATEARTVASIVAVTATGGSFLDSPVTADTLVAFALPRRGPPDPYAGRKRLLVVADLSTGNQIAHLATSHAIATIEKLGRESGAYVAILRTDTDLVTKGEVWGTGEYAADGPRRARMHNLDYFDAVLFYTNGETRMTEAQKRDLLDFIGKDGKGFIGVHTAAITAASWPEYAEMLGGFFDNHPWNVASARIVVERPDSPIMRGFSTGMELVDEHYQLLPQPYDRSKVDVLARLDPTSVDLADADVHRSDADFPVAWIKPYGNGRVFYSYLGHTDAAWDDPRVQTMYLEAIKWAIDGGETPRPHALTAP